MTSVDGEVRRTDKKGSQQYDASLKGRVGAWNAAVKAYSLVDDRSLRCNVSVDHGQAPAKKLELQVGPFVLFFWKKILRLNSESVNFSVTFPGDGDDRGRADGGGVGRAIDDVPQEQHAGRLGAGHQPWPTGTPAERQRRRQPGQRRRRHAGPTPGIHLLTVPSCTVHPVHHQTLLD